MYDKLIISIITCDYNNNNDNNYKTTTTTTIMTTTTTMDLHQRWTYKNYKIIKKWHQRWHALNWLQPTLVICFLVLIFSCFTDAYTANNITDTKCWARTSILAVVKTVARLVSKMI